MLTWTITHPAVDLGMLPMIFLERDPRPARMHAEERYRHGGGWSPLKGWVMEPSNVGVPARQRMIAYPGDPPLRPLAWTQLLETGETILVYESSWVCILQADGSYEVARMD